MRVRRLRADEWERWRGFRLAMLEEAPYAFGTTLAEAAAYTEDQWRERARRLAEAGDNVMYVVEDDGESWLACAGGYVEEDGTPNVFGVWTHPDARGRGAARLAVEHVIAWAGTTGAGEVRLWATDTNVTARHLYERLGFAPNGSVQPLPSDPSLTESEWSRPL
ncbi:MAG TPA: GNAT family N-acetyltransferase [Frankiaceae bacterium]|jgi:predicted GNAT family acetyltransferase|nr:GNAT family N-acetyltransferase [Frankiaceae bacterium]